MAHHYHRQYSTFLDIQTELWLAAAGFFLTQEGDVSALSLLLKSTSGKNKKYFPCFTVQCFLRFCFAVKTSADKMILQIFDIFSHDFSLFSTQLTLFRPKNSIGLKKD